MFKRSLIAMIVTLAAFALAMGCGGSSSSDDTGSGTGPGTGTSTGTYTFPTGTGNPGDPFPGGTVPGSATYGLATSPTTQCIPGGRADEVECLNLINQERANYGLTAVQWDDTLADLARSHADDMAQRGYFGHGSASSPSSYLANERAQVAGIAGLYENNAGHVMWENCFMWPQHSATPAQVVTEWMNSTGHRENILKSFHRHGGVGYAIAGDGTTYYVVEFSERK